MINLSINLESYMSSGESLAHTINDTIKLLCMLLIKFVDFFC